MEDFDRIVMISPVGLEKDRVLAGLKNFGVTNIYLIQSIGKKNAEKRLSDTVRIFASDLKVYLEKIMADIYIKEANITNLKDCLRVLSEIIKEEKKIHTKKIYINISTSSKIFAVAAVYISGLDPSFISPFYVKTSNYLIQDFIEILENQVNFKDEKEKVFNRLIKLKEKFDRSGWTTGKYEVSLIPALPFKNFSEFQKEIFQEISKNNNKCQLQDLIKNLKSEDVKERSFRSKLSYALRNLLDYGIIKKLWEGRKKYLILTEIGEIFSEFLI